MIALDSLLLCLSVIPGGAVIAALLTVPRRIQQDAVHLLILVSAGMVGFSLLGVVTLIASLEATRIAWPLVSAAVWIAALVLAWRSENNPARSL